jgi:4-amino-4-deoxy-L-arabinose transferase-like glycosyltransferase
VPLLLAIILPWFIAIGLATHGRFFADAVGGDLGNKLAGGSESHGAPPGLHLLLLPLLAFPATIPVLLGLATAWRTRRAGAPVFLLAWLIPAWLVFEAVPTKLPHYTLPLYPALFLLAAAGLRDMSAPRWLRSVAVGLTALAALLIGAGAVAAPLLLHAAWWLGVPALCATALVLAAAVSGNAAAAIPASVLLFAAVLQLEIPSLTALWLAPGIVATLRQGAPAIGPDGAGVVTAGYDEPSLMFLAGTHISFWPSGAAAARFSARRTPEAAVVASSDVASFNAASTRLGLSWQKIGHVEGVNTARGQAIGLDIFVRSIPLQKQDNSK